MKSSPWEKSGWREIRLELLGRAENGRGVLGQRRRGNLQIVVEQIVMNGAAVVYFPRKFLKYYISFLKKEKMLQIFWCACFFCPTLENKQSKKAFP